MNKRRAAGLAVLLATAIAAAAAWWLLAERGDLRPPRRSGPPALVSWGGPTVLWLLTRQEEHRHSGRGSHSLWHFDLHGHDVQSTRRLWSRRLLTVRDTQGGREATGRILGQQGPVVWLFLHDQPVALSHVDGSVQGGAHSIVERNPGLQPMWPADSRSFAFDRQLIVSTADALHWRVDSQTFAATAYQPDDAERFERVRFMASGWNGSYQTVDFTTRHLRDLEGRWVGLFSDREATDAADDGFGEHFKSPDQVLDEGAAARRRFRVATVGKTRAFSEGRHDRLMSLPAAPDSPVFLQGRLLRASQSRDALAPGADGGAMVLHRSRIDDAGLLSLTRVDPLLKPRWTQVLPIAELHNRWELGDRLLLLGSVSRDDGRARQAHELLLSVDLQNGILQHFDIESARGP